MDTTRFDAITRSCNDLNSRRTVIRQALGGLLAVGGATLAPAGSSAKKICKKGKQACGKKCVNTKTSEKNCGKCGKQCKAGQSCHQGTCVAKSYPFVKNWGSFGTGNANLKYPDGIAVSPDGKTIFVVDTENHRVKRYGADGAYEWHWGEKGAQDDDFNNPTGVAVSPDGNRVYVADTKNHTVKVFDTWGDVKQVWGGLGSNQGQLDTPRYVAVSPDGQTIYVTEQENHRVSLFDPNGTCFAMWGGPNAGDGFAAYNSPQGIAISPDGKRVYVADALNGRVKVLSADGKDLFDMWDGDELFGKPHGVAVSADGNRVYVTDSQAHELVVLMLKVKKIERIGTQGAGPKQFQVPKGVATGGSGAIYVADAWNHRIQTLKLK